jgi:transposase-like protein
MSSAKVLPRSPRDERTQGGVKSEERVVRMYRATEPPGPQITRLAIDLGAPAEALRGWIRQAEAEADADERDDRLTTDERAELAALRKENAQIKRANEVLRTAPAFFPRRPAPGGAVEEDQVMTRLTLELVTMPTRRPLREHQGPAGGVGVQSRQEAQGIVGTGGRDVAERRHHGIKRGRVAVFHWSLPCLPYADQPRRVRLGRGRNGRRIWGSSRAGPARSRAVHGTWLRCPSWSHGDYEPTDEQQPHTAREPAGQGRVGERTADRRVTAAGANGRRRSAAAHSTARPLRRGSAGAWARDCCRRPSARSSPETGLRPRDEAGAAM